MAALGDCAVPLMRTPPKIMVLDGDFTHTLAVQRELKQHLDAEIISVASSPLSPGYLSRHTDLRVIAPPSSSEAFGEALVGVAAVHKPDLIVPIGFSSNSAVIARAAELLPFSQLLAPSVESFSRAASKTLTYQSADEVGVRAPLEYGTDSAALADALPTGDYPIFAKARFERGGISTALIRSAEELRRFDPEALGGDVIFQEYINGDPFTYAHCGYFVDGKPVVSMEHIEQRSVPRRGGSGTRVVSASIPELARQASTLLSHLSWTGVAQVEFKMAANGDFILMEINPKLWASYALASRSGHPIVASAAARLLDFELQDTRAARLGMAMVFPVRELLHVAANIREENVFSSSVAMLWPPAHIDFDLADLRAHVPRRRRKAAQ
ncbi:ATP-grasp domain-containing protein [Microbacterium sp. AGC62]